VNGHDLTGFQSPLGGWLIEMSVDVAKFLLRPSFVFIDLD